MIEEKFQKFFENLGIHEKEQEAFIMLGLIFSFIFIILIGVLTGRSLAMIL